MKLQWKQPNTSTLLCMLHHPIYYGAYVYGRRKTDPKKVVKGSSNSGRVWPPRDQWDVLIEDQLPAYISKPQFEQNQRKFWENAAKYRLGTAMRGTSMLAGRVVCGHCGRHMSVSYSGQSKERLTCEMTRNQWGEKQCQSFNARSLGELVSSLLLQAVSPASIERVVIETVGRSEYVNVMIRWSGGFESRHRILKPVGRFEWLESAAEIRELIERLKREGKTHAEVSAELNREGYHSTSCSSFTPAIVSSLCKKFREEKSPTAANNKSEK